MQSKTLVAITGGIGSGKSSATEILRTLGEEVFSCDEIYKEVLSDRATLKKINGEFKGTVSGVFKKTLDRKKLSSIVFIDEEKLKKLNSITHPEIINKLQEKIDASKNDLIFVEIPLLFEGGYRDMFDKIVIIMRNESDRIRDVISRSNLSEEEIRARIKSQTDYEKLDKSDFTVIYNDGTKEELKNTLIGLVKDIKYQTQI